MNRIFKVFGDFSVDIINLAIVAAVGWFLIGFFTKGQYLETGYNDWLYHAYRIEFIEDYGIPSWNFIWGNGANVNRTYHYTSHYLAIWTKSAFDLATTQSMIAVTLAVFFLTRFIIYTTVRIAGVDKKWALAATLLSYTYPNQWATIKDYAAYVNGIAVVIFTSLIIASYRFKNLLYVLSAITGLLFLHHLLTAIVAGSLLAARILTTDARHSVGKMFIYFLLALPGVIAYAVPYLHAGERYNNPFHQSVTFFTNTVIGENFGIGLFFMSFAVLFWGMLLVFGPYLKSWAKLLLLYSTVYLIFVWLGINNYLPEPLIKTQFARGVTYIGAIAPFIIAGFLQYFSGKRAHFFVLTLATIVTTYSIFYSITIATRWSAQPINELTNTEIITELQRLSPTGSVSVNYNQVGKTSYLAGDSLRMINTYNEQLLPSPFAVRFNQLLKNDISYTGISNRQMQLINDYATVLGVEYIVVSEGSPFEVSTKLGLAENNQFEIIGTYGTQTLLKNQNPIAYTYIAEQADIQDIIKFTPLPKPTTDSVSYLEWDNAVSDIAGAIRSGILKPIPTSIQPPDTAIFSLDKNLTQNIQNPILISSINYDPNWQTNSSAVTAIRPTQTRFLYAKLSPNPPSTIILNNRWPSWHWPLQYTPVVAISVSTFFVTVPILISAIHTRKATKKALIFNHNPNLPHQYSPTT